MDWPVFALITYAFLLALLLAGFILRSLKAAKGQYQRLLEEKEQKLLAMQMDMEDILEGLQAQAALLENEWSAAQRHSQDSLLTVQDRLLELQGTIAGLQSRIYRLEREPRDHLAGAVEGWGPFLGAEPAPLWPEARLPEEDAGARGEREPPRQRALALLQRGMSIAQVSREMGFSKTEATLLYNQWQRGFLKEDLAYGPEE